MTDEPRRRVCAMLMTALALTVVLPAASAGHDGDPFLDDGEEVLCEREGARELVNGLPSSAGRCRDKDDYEHGIFQPAACDGACRRDLVNETDMQLTEGQDVPLATIELYHDEEDDERYCVKVTTEMGRGADQCVEVESRQVRDGLPEKGPIPLVRLNATSMDLIIRISWNETMLNCQVCGEPLEVWEPVDMADEEARKWWTDHPDETELYVEVTFKADGEPVKVGGDPVSVQQDVDYAGQAVAAALRNIGSLPDGL